MVQYILFLPDWLARYWVWLTSTVLLLFWHSCLPTSMWKLIICHVGWLLLQWHLLPHIDQAAFCIWVLPEVDLLVSSCTIQCQHYYTFENSLPQGTLWLNAFNHPWKYQEAYNLSYWLAASGVTSSSSHCKSSFLPLGSTRGGSVGILLYHSMPALLHLWNFTTSGGLGVECLQPSLEVSGKLCFSSCCISSSSSVQVSGRIWHRAIQTFYSGGTMLDGGFLASYNSQHVGRHSLVPSCHRRLHHGCFCRPGAQGSAISAFNVLAAHGYDVVQTWVLFLSLSGSGRGNSSIKNKGLSAMLERMGRIVSSIGCINQCHICP